jgi:predicted histone-like DNA-binding protein
MALRLKKIQRKNPMEKGESKWYLTQKRAGQAENADIAAEIAGRSALSAGDVQSVLVNLADVLPRFLGLGQSVSIAGLGSFRPFALNQRPSARIFHYSLLIAN